MMNKRREKQERIREKLPIYYIIHSVVVLLLSFIEGWVLGTVGEDHRALEGKEDMPHLLSSFPFQRRLVLPIYINAHRHTYTHIHSPLSIFCFSFSYITYNPPIHAPTLYSLLFVFLALSLSLLLLCKILGAGIRTYM